MDVPLRCAAATNYAAGDDIKAIDLYRSAGRNYEEAERAAARGDRALREGDKAGAAEARDVVVDLTEKAAKGIGELGTDAAVAAELDAEERRVVQPSLGSLRLRLVHGDQPVNEYSSKFWSWCFPLRFPCGDAADGVERSVALRDDEWSETLLRRDDRRWRRDLDFIAVASSVLMRRKI
eukprot:gene25674-44900_t